LSTVEATKLSLLAVSKIVFIAPPSKSRTTASSLRRLDRKKIKMKRTAASSVESFDANHPRDWRQLPDPMTDFGREKREQAKT
jgi:hypothetical protein